MTITCTYCLEAESDTTWTRPGGKARAELGHAYYHSADGRIAACAARVEARSAAASTLGRAGGAVRSARKAQAVSANGMKGGRPRKGIRVANVYTGAEMLVCKAHLDANVIGNPVHDLLGDVQVQAGLAPAGACVACEAGFPVKPRKRGATLPEITRADIGQLAAEALAAGDGAQMGICERALNGSARAWRECQRVIRDAKAQQ